jgi:hypothetical protein
MTIHILDEDKDFVSPSRGIVVEEDQKQREFYDAVNEWSGGNISYDEMYSKVPERKADISLMIMKRIISYLRGKKK